MSVNPDLMLLEFHQCLGQNCDFIKIKAFCTSKDAIKKVKPL
jgi:hypothetical protein